MPVICYRKIDEKTVISDFAIRDTAWINNILQTSSKAW